MRNCFQYPLEVHSETSNDQAFPNPFYHLPRSRLSPPPPPQANIDYVHREEIGENVSSILLKGFQKLQITRLFSNL